MIDKIRSIKDEMLVQAEKDMQQNGMVDPTVIDNIKDLAEAEKYCMESEKLGMEADYFDSVVEAMQESPMGYDGGMGYARGGRGGYGYNQGGQGGYGYERGGNGGYGYEQGGRGYRRGYEQGGRGNRRGYRGQPRDSQGRYMSRRGYRRMESYGHEDMMQEIKQMARQMMETADPQEKEQLKMQLRQMSEQM